MNEIMIQIQYCTGCGKEIEDNSIVISLSIQEEIIKYNEDGRQVNKADELALYHKECSIFKEY